MKINAFTLTEIIIGIAIIVILVSSVAIVGSRLLKQSRDNQRQSDVRNVQMALEEYKRAFGSYPEEANWLATLIEQGYLASEVVDPRDGMPIPGGGGETYGYDYEVSDDGQSYLLKTPLEEVGSGGIPKYLVIDPRGASVTEGTPTPGNGGGGGNNPYPTNYFFSTSTPIPTRTPTASKTPTSSPTATKTPTASPTVPNTPTSSPTSIPTIPPSITPSNIPTIPPPSATPTVPACHAQSCQGLGSACCISGYICSNDHNYSIDGSCLPRIMPDGRNNCANCGYWDEGSASDYYQCYGEDNGSVSPATCAMGGGLVNYDCENIVCWD